MSLHNLAPITSWLAKQTKLDEKEEEDEEGKKKLHLHQSNWQKDIISLLFIIIIMRCDTK